MRNQIRSLYEQYGSPMLANFTRDDLKGDIPAKSGVFTLADWDGRVVLIKRKPQNDYPGLERYWWLPGGGFEPPECIDEGAAREFREETGLEIQLTKLLIARFRNNKRFSFFFRGHVTGGCLDLRADPTNEIADVRCFLPSEIPVQDLWSDLDKIVLTKEGFVDDPVDDLIEKHGLKPLLR
jgi:ADP-ribose pyrophosphatase YjhB (NUDIX family)